MQKNLIKVGKIGINEGHTLSLIRNFIMKRQILILAVAQNT